MLDPSLILLVVLPAKVALETSGEASVSVAASLDVLVVAWILLIDDWRHLFGTGALRWFEDILHEPVSTSCPHHRLVDQVAPVHQP